MLRCEVLGWQAGAGQQGRVPRFATAIRHAPKMGSCATHAAAPLVEGRCKVSAKAGLCLGDLGTVLGSRLSGFQDPPLSATTSVPPPKTSSICVCFTPIRPSSTQGGSWSPHLTSQIRPLRVKAGTREGSRRVWPHLSGAWPSAVLRGLQLCACRSSSSRCTRGQSQHRGDL
jgi:hypothetical protein